MKKIKSLPCRLLALCLAIVMATTLLPESMFGGTGLSEVEAASKDSGGKSGDVSQGESEADSVEINLDGIGSESGEKETSGEGEIEPIDAETIEESSENLSSKEIKKNLEKPGEDPVAAVDEEDFLSAEFQSAEINEGEEAQKILLLSNASDNIPVSSAVTESGTEPTEETSGEEGTAEEVENTENTAEETSEATTEEAEESSTEEVPEATTETQETEVLTGECGEALTWTYDQESKNLTVAGSGAMTDYTDESTVPWAEYKEEIQTLTVEDGVSSIGQKAFADCTQLTSAVLTDDIEKIGFRAFAGCVNLSEINIPLSWTECPTSNSDGTTYNVDCCGQIFTGCESLTKLVIPEGMTAIPSYGFNKCDYLETVELPDTIDTIKNHTFYGCTNLNTVTIPENVTYIGKSAFYNCESIQSIEIPDGVTELALYAFDGCTGLKSAVLPDSIEKIGFRAFADCTALSEINIPLNWTECPTSNTDGTTYNVDYCGHIFEGCESLRKLVIPEGMTAIPSYGFNKCDYLETVELPDTIDTIKNHTFYNCTNLNTVTIPDKVTYIGKSAFCYCTALSEVKIPDGVTELALYTFYDCESLKSVELPDSIEKLGYQSFADCTALSEVNIPLNWTECPTSNNDGTTCNSTYCGHIFEGCSSLTSLEIPEGMKTIPSYGLCYSNYLKEIKLPESLTEINNHIFYGCSSLESISVPDGIETIKKSAFCYCSNLKKVTLPDSLKELVDYAFYECKALEEIELPDSIEKLGYSVFANCTALTKINIPKNWNECPSSVENKSGLNYQGSILAGCSKLTTITLPEGLEQIPDYGFAYCNYLKIISLSESLTGIGNYSFYGCTSLMSVNIPAGVKTIPEYAFASCSTMLVVNMPKQLKTVEENAFSGSESIKTINYQGEKENWSAVIVASEGNDSISDVTINYNFKVSYAKKDFLGAWEGEYDGRYGSTIVRRHFVVNIEECKVNGNQGVISGKLNISYSKEVDSEYSENGSYQFNGVVDLATGTFFYQGHTWIEYPDISGNHQFFSFQGYMEPDKSRISGMIEGVSNRTFYADLIGSSVSSNTTVTLTQGEDKIDLLKEKKNISENSSDKVTITVIPDWGSAKEGTVRIYQKDVAIESKTGVFLDIVPAKIFKASQNIYVDLVDADGKTVETRKILLWIAPDNATDTKSQTTTWYDIWCVGDQYKSYTRGFTLNVGDKKYETGNDYRASADIPKSAADQVSISKNGYITCDIPKELVYSCHEAILYQDSTKTPFAQFVALKESARTIYENISASGMMVYQNSMTAYDLYVDINWNGATAGKVYLKQGDQTLDLKEGKNEKLILGTTLSQDGGDIYLCWQTADGSEHSQKVKITVCDSSVSNLKIDGGEKSSGKNSDSSEEDEVWGDLSFSFDLLSDSCPVEMTLSPQSATKGTFKGTLGIKLNNKSATNSVFDYVKNRVEFIHSGYIGNDSIKNVVKNLEKGGNTVAGTANEYGFSVDTQMIGYMEGTYEIGSDGRLVDMKFEDSGVTASFTGAASTTRQHFATPVPWYWQLEIKADLGLKMSFENEYDGSMASVAPVNSDSSLEIGAKAAVGCSGLASVGVKGSGTMHLDGQILPFDTSTMDIYADYKIKLIDLEVASWTSGDKTPTYESDEYYLLKKGEWFPDNSKKSSKAKSLLRAAGNILGISDTTENDSAQNNSTEMVQTSREDEGTEASVFSVNEEADDKDAADDSSAFKTNTYTNTEPQIVNLGEGKKLMVWVDDAGEESRPADVNRGALYFSVYENEKWSTPQMINDDKTADSYPVLSVVDGTAYLAWINENKVLTAEDTFSDYCKAMDIAYARFDGETNAFADVSTIETNEQADFLPAITVVGGKPAIAWISNTENDPVQGTGTNCVRTAILEDGSWTVHTWADDLQMIDGLCVSDEEDVLNVYVSQDQDEDISTIDDKEIFRITESGAEQVTDNKAADVKPFVSDGKIYWYSGGQLTDGAENIELAQDTDRIYTASDGENAVILYVKINEDNSSTVYGSFKDSYGWGQPVEVLKSDRYLSKLDACYSDGVLNIVTNESQIVNDERQNTGIYLYKIGEKYDLALSNLNYQPVSSGNDEIQFSAEVSNKGNCTVREATLSVYLGEELLQSETIDLGLKAGEEDLITFSCEKSKIGTSNPEMKAVIDLSEQKETDVENNKVSCTFPTKDVSVEEIQTLYVNGKTTVSAYIANRGLEKLENIKVSLRQDSKDGKVLGSKEIKEIEVDKGEVVSFEGNSLAEGTVVYVVAEALENENTETNNYAFTEICPEEKIDVSGDIKDSSGNKDNTDENKTDTKPSTEKTTEKNKENTKPSSRKKAVRITALRLTGISKQIAAGKKIKLTAWYKPFNAAKPKVKWTSSNKKIATVTQNGVVTLKKKSGGKSVIITAAALDGSGKKATFKIKSMKGVVKKVTIKGRKSVKAGKKLKLKAKVKATKKANKKLLWSSSNTKYATVNARGVVKTKKAGKGKKVRITAKATDGSGKKATVKIKIK